MRMLLRSVWSQIGCSFRVWPSAALASPKPLTRLSNLSVRFLLLPSSRTRNKFREPTKLENFLSSQDRRYSVSTPEPLCYTQGSRRSAIPG